VNAPSRWIAPGLAIAPSVLAADFGRLADEVRRVVDAGADLLHLDVMDGHFVPNLTMGPAIVKACRKATDLPLDVHMMVTDPLSYVDPFIDAGADSLTFHVEAPGDPRVVIDAVRRRGCRVGVAVNPGTGLEAVWPLVEVAGDVDMVLCMTVHPGFGGQSFISDVLDKVQQLHDCRPDLPIEVDGGLTAETVGPAAAAGATLIVAGTSVFRASDVAAAIATLRANGESSRAQKSASSAERN
jgi:ribulose-phosphate 3-epimerase